MIVLVASCRHADEAVMNLDCHGAARTLRTIDPSTLRAVASGIDRVYCAAEIPAPVAVTAASELARLRASFVVVTGVEPPPVAIALVTHDLDVFIAKDRDGRMVWAVDAARFERDRDLSLIAHEQTHAILGGRLPIDPRARFLEEGLAEYVEHLVMGGRGGPGRARAVLEGSAAGRVDLLELGELFDPARYPSTLAFMRAMCRPVTDRRGILLTSPMGYALGLAYWLNRDAREPGILGRVLASKPQSIDALLRLARDGEGGFTARDLDLEAARAQLAAAAPADAPSVAPER